MTDDEGHVRALITRYALALDTGDVDGCVQLFVPDAEFVVYGRTFAGRDAIGRMFRDAPRGLHLTGVSEIAVRGDSATVRSQVLFVRAGDQQLRPAVYHDELVRADGHWRFRRRDCQFVTSDGLSDSPEVPPT